jgi:hypothetical protein
VGEYLVLAGFDSIQNDADEISRSHLGIGGISNHGTVDISDVDPTTWTLAGASSRRKELVADQNAALGAL